MKADRLETLLRRPAAFGLLFVVSVWALVDVAVLVLGGLVEPFAGLMAWLGRYDPLGSAIVLFAAVRLAAAPLYASAALMRMARQQGRAFVLGTLHAALMAIALYLLVRASRAVEPAWLERSAWFFGADWRLGGKVLFLVVLGFVANGIILVTCAVHDRGWARTDRHRPYLFPATVPSAFLGGIGVTTPLVAILALFHGDSHSVVTVVLGVLIASLLADLVLVRLLGGGIIRLNWAGRNLRGLDLSGARLIRPRLTKADLTEANMDDVVLVRAELNEADLGFARLSRANLSEADLRGTNLGRADLVGAVLENADVLGADFEGADLSETHITDVDFSAAKLCGARLSGARLHRVSLNGVNLSGLDLSGAQLTHVSLRNADLRGTDLSGTKSHALDLGGASVDGATLSGAILYGPGPASLDLAGVVLSGVNLSGAALGLIRLDRADLSGLDFNGAQLFKVSLRDADLRRANLRAAVFMESNLRGADLAEADLCGAELDGARGLDQGQIDLAIGDEDTKLPSRLQRPQHWDHK